MGEMAQTAVTKATAQIADRMMEAKLSSLLKFSFLSSFAIRMANPRSYLINRQIPARSARKSGLTSVERAPCHFEQTSRSVNRKLKGVTARR